MRPVVIADIPVILPAKDIATRLRIREGSTHEAELGQMISEAEAIARPKAICGVAYIEERGDDYLVVDGTRLSSRVLAVNLESVNRVFPYVATCGTELEQWASRFDDLLYRYWSEAIRESAMRLAFSAIEGYLERSYGVVQMARMNPGSLADWPIEQQRPLFAILGDVEQAVGVRLLDSCLMLPTKSVSGVRFTASSNWENCMLCPRPTCPNRRAPYDPALYDARFRKSTT